VPRFVAADQRLLSPALTGLWQVEGPSTIISDERVVLDNEHVIGWSITRDVEIFGQNTVGAIAHR
jgi:lipopolysaccharide/colanic/teichoic acid biosynthesis glycosyltransferase